MPTVVVVFGILIAGMGLWGLIAPSGLVALTERFLKGHGLWIAVVIRLGLALALWFAASTSYTPGAFRFLAALTLFAALFLPLFGQKRLDAFIGWWAAQPGWLIRMTCLCVVGFGGFLAWSAGAPLAAA